MAKNQNKIKIRIAIYFGIILLAAAAFLFSGGQAQAGFSGSSGWYSVYDPYFGGNLYSDSNIHIVIYSTGETLGGNPSRVISNFNGGTNGQSYTLYDLSEDPIMQVSPNAFSAWAGCGSAPFRMYVRDLSVHPLTFSELDTWKNHIGDPSYYSYVAGGGMVVYEPFDNTYKAPPDSFFGYEVFNSCMPPPSISFSANPASVTTGSSSTLNWYTSGSPTCTASGGWSGGKAVYGSQTVTPSNTTTYTLSCTNAVGTTSKSVTIQVTQPPVNGACVSYDGQFLTAAPTNLCNSGNPSAVSQNGQQWNWTCNGINGGTNDNCSASIPENGVCVSYINQSLTSAPTDLCASGTPSQVSGTGPWTWTCSGTNGGTTATCNASLPPPVNGTCVSYSQPLTSEPANLCSQGNPSAVSQNGQQWNWTCFGSYGGTDDTCIATQYVAPPPPVPPGDCGSDSTQILSSTPTNLCDEGTPSEVLGSGPWTWSCSGNPPANCQAGVVLDSPSATPPPPPPPPPVPQPQPTPAPTSYIAGLVPCGWEGNPCKLCHLVVGIKNLLQFGFWILVALAVLAIFIAGVMYVVSAGSEPMIQKAKSFLKAALVGVAVVLGAWLMVYVTLRALSAKDDLGIGISGWNTFTCNVGQDAPYVPPDDLSDDTLSFTGNPTRDMFPSGTGTDAACNNAVSGQNLSSPPAEADRCVVGSPSAVSDNGRAWGWTCRSPDGGASADCYAYVGEALPTPEPVPSPESCPTGFTQVQRHGEDFCENTAYVWTQQLDHGLKMHFLSNGTITYSNECGHGSLSSNPSYNYPFSYDPTIFFPIIPGTEYDITYSGNGSCQLWDGRDIGFGCGASATVPSYSSNEIIIGILEPSGGEHVCTANITKFIPLAAVATTVPQHTANECASAGGTWVSTGTSDVCRFDAGNCPAGWNTTAWKTITGNTCDGNSCGSGTACTVPDYDWGNNVVNSQCQYNKDKMNCGEGCECQIDYQNSPATCYADITQIGCF